MDPKERARQIVEEVLPAIQELAKEGQQMITEVEERAYANLNLLTQYEGELEDLARRLEAIRRELEAAPTKLAKATLEGDTGEEQKIR